MQSNALLYIYISDKIKKHTKEEDMPHLGSCLSLGKGDMIMWLQQETKKTLPSSITLHCLSLKNEMKSETEAIKC